MVISIEHFDKLIANCRISGQRSISRQRCLLNQKSHHRFEEFSAWIAGQREEAIPVSGDFFRVAGPRHTSAKELVSGIGARRAGGRWNPIGMMNIVYTSRNPATAMIEATEHYRYYRLPMVEAMPKVVVAVRIRLESVLDLTEGFLSKSLPEPIDTLLSEDWRAIMERGYESTSQALGRAAFQTGLNGLIVPSKPDPTGSNFLIFPENLTSKCRMRVLNPKLLDKLGKAS